jgi:ribosome-binding protein aMBF1 (putative translation factor)
MFIDKNDSNEQKRKKAEERKKRKLIDDELKKDDDTNERVKFFREQLNWSQNELAGHARCCEEYINKIEKRKTYPSSFRLRKIVKALGQTMYTFYSQDITNKDSRGTNGTTEKNNS